MKTLRVFVVVALMGASGFADDAAEFESLFNGTDLSGWEIVGAPKAFDIADGAIRTLGAAPYPSWLRSKEQYENFVLRFSYKTSGWYEGGVLFLAPLDGPTSTIGCKLHLKHTNKAYGLRSTGAIYDVAAPTVFPAHKAGSWNQVEILSDWPVLRISINGKVVQDIDRSKHDGFKHRLRRGYIGFQDICSASGYYKDVTIRTLPDKEQWTDLFTAADSVTHTSGAQWAYDADTATFTGTGRGGLAFSKEAFSAPYELQVWVKTMVNGNGGVTFNAAKPNGHGIEIQCFNVPDSTNPTGSLYDIDPATRVVSRDEEWFLMQLFNYGKHVEVYVNGEQVSSSSAIKPPYRGRIGFQHHSPGGIIHYRGARIKKLENPAPK